ncbi:MAG: hypothetical protein LBU89_13270 [Fibromonadaceae bacterium]|jgi:hypothetical protein|nr:hypothetical protein [Fibromonadaceae bacterium]
MLISRLLALIVFAVAITHAQVPLSYDGNDRVNFLLHPIGTFVLSTTHSLAALYLTAELSLDEHFRHNYLVFHPSLLANQDIIKLGSGIGFRHYPGSNYNGGFYMQIMPSAHYLKFSISEGNRIGAVSGSAVDVLGYVGYSFRNVAFLDVGIGYGWAFLPNNYRAYNQNYLPENYRTYPFSYPYSYFGKNKHHGLTFDINLAFDNYIGFLIFIAPIVVALL